ncbi:MAG TPA: DUF4389 domain-containing protein [Acidimicrobiales bacterium]|nr:DUF4389 domain-containing protein [Acidimicrobiales bacterium]
MNDSTTGAVTEPAPHGQSNWTAGRVVMVVIASIVALLGLAMLAAGGALTWAATTHRDDAGFFHTDSKRFSSASYAITSDEVDFGTDVRPGRDGFEPGDLVRVRLRASSSDSTRPVFLGIARTADVDGYLSGVAHDVIRDVRLRPFEVDYRAVSGTREPTAPQAETFWILSSAGTDTQSIVWEPGDGNWAIVVMNADASRGVVADIDVGVEIRHLWLIVGIVLVLGIVLLGTGIAVIITVAHRAARDVGPPPGGDQFGSTVPASPTPVSGLADDPVVVRSRLDAPLSRWLWLVKWILAIPHLIVLALLWIAAIMLTVIAGVAILFTGRYPRRIFDFNVGVLRWTWRVAFYATGVLGTDRYPPFTLRPVDTYPATLDVLYPAQLSRGLVLVKWWLLALPHYVVVGIIGSGWWWGTLRVQRDWDGRAAAWSGGLLGVLVLVAGVRLLFTGRYPRDMFGLITGLNRWVYRVVAYAMLMTDVYPPFRLDQGGETRRDIAEEP